MKKNVIWTARSADAKRLRLFVVRTGLRAGTRVIRGARTGR